MGPTNKQVSSTEMFEDLQQEFEYRETAATLRHHAEICELERIVQQQAEMISRLQAKPALHRVK